MNILFVNCRYRHDIVTFLNNLLIIDEYFRKHCPRMLYKSYSEIYWHIIYFNVGLSGYLVLRQTLIMWAFPEQFTYYCRLHLFNYMTLTGIGQFVCFLYLLKQRFAMINYMLKKIRYQITAEELLNMHNDKYFSRILAKIEEIFFRMEDLQRSLFSVYETLMLTNYVLSCFVGINYLYRIRFMDNGWQRIHMSLNCCFVAFRVGFTAICVHVTDYEVSFVRLYGMKEMRYRKQIQYHI